MIAQAVGIGIIISFLFAELIGYSAGGLITSGYLALFLNQPLRILATFTVAIASYFTVLFMSNFIILYGRRRFMAAILITFIYGQLFESVLIVAAPTGFDFRAIGYIVPGLIANDMIKQGILGTVCSSLIVSTLVYVVLQLIAF